MRFLPPKLRVRLSDAGLLPTSKLARAAWYVLWQDVFLFLLKQVLSLSGVSWADSLSGAVVLFSLVAIVLFMLLGLRELRARMLWRLRNRLIVTYVFIGVIPVVLLVALALGSFYLFAGQFATFIVTTSLNSELKSVDAANAAIAHELAARLNPDAKPEPLGIESLRRSNQAWSRRHVHVWHDGKLLLSSSPDGAIATVPVLPAYLKDSFNEIVRDHGELFLRAVETVTTPRGRLTVLSSEPLDAHMLQGLANNLGELTLYTTGLSRVTVNQKASDATSTAKPASPSQGSVTYTNPNVYVFDTSKNPPPSFVIGNVPPPTRWLDEQVSFATAISVVDWDTGDTTSPAAVAVQTRISTLYGRLFGALGDFAPAIEYSLFVVAVFLAIIELIALWIGTRLTRTVTGAVAELYEATEHINRGDFSHRIAVKSSDQIATLANSFNSMTTSLEELIAEQKEKQRLEGELAIAQEVQEQLYPGEISQMASLEVHGFCRPARTVSGDYYDFLTLDSDRMLLAVGDISGKGISAALLMATIHSAVRAYSENRAPVLHEAAAAGVAGSDLMLATEYTGETSPGTLLALLNHQLYISTPPEKYATLFLATYDGRRKTFTYSNGGHLQPIVLHQDGSLTRLDRGGTVIGLFDDCVYDEGSVHLQPGDVFIAYSDGVTEPENDFDEFGEQRLIDLVRENRDLPLVRITEIVVAAVADWIGANEQPDDITLVLARAR
jgi:sigma-B regulation protein RsbU (phosphoserine phosphatase)